MPFVQTASTGASKVSFDDNDKKNLQEFLEEYRNLLKGGLEQDAEGGKGEHLQGIAERGAEVLLSNMTEDEAGAFPELWKVSGLMVLTNSLLIDYCLPECTKLPHQPQV